MFAMSGSDTKVSKIMTPDAKFEVKLWILGQNLGERCIGELRLHEKAAKLGLCRNFINPSLRVHKKG